MALEFVGGALFTMLYDGVKQTMSKSSTFKSLLGDLKSTLDGLAPRDIQQIGEHNVELGLPNEEIENLQTQMEEGVKLVCKLSNLRMWNYCCLNDYTEQIVELDRALKRLLQKLRMQEARDVKEVLVLSRQNRDKLDEVHRRLLDIQKLLHQNLGNSMENLALESNTQTTMEHVQGNGVDIVTLDKASTSLAAVFFVLFEVVIEVEAKATMFKSILGDLKSTLESLKPLVEEIEEHNKVLELEDFRIQMEKSVELIRKCSNLGVLASCKKYKYTEKLLALNESLQRLLNILKVQLARDVSKTFASIRNIEAVVKQIEESSGLCTLSKSLSLTERKMDVNETLGLVKSTKLSVEQIEGSGAVQNQIETQGMSENDSRDRISRTSSSTESQITGAKGQNMNESQTVGKILEELNLRVFSFAELKAATRDFSPRLVLGGGSFGQVFKGWMDEETLGPSKTGTGMMVAIKKLTLENMQVFPDDWQSDLNFIGKFSHPNLVKLLGYCWEASVLSLVFEFMERGSLEMYLFERNLSIPPLSWNIRLRIAIGAAQGLAFLHTHNKAAYRDFNSSNILLDEIYNAKLSGFSDLIEPSTELPDVPMGIMGVVCYSAPEYIATGHFSVKSAVYSFGVVLLEILTGLRASRPIEQHSMVYWAKPFLSQKRKFKTIVDKRLQGQYPLKGALQMANIILKCLAIDPGSRPSMKEVVEALEQVEAVEEFKD